MHGLSQLSTFGHQLDGTLQRYKALVYPQRYWDYRRWLQQQVGTEQLHQLAHNQPVVVFDFRDSRIDGPQGRRFYSLFIYFVRAGFYPVLRNNYLVLGNIQEKHKRYCLQENFSVLTHERDLPAGYVLVTDKWYSNLAERAGKIIHINYQPDYNTNDSCFPMPFPLFPPLYAAKEDLHLAYYREQDRQWKIFFGGDAEPGKYNKKSIREIYAKLSRTQILERLSQRLPNDFFWRLNNPEQLKQAEQSSYPGLIAMNTRHCKVASEEWLGTMARAHFFLACPGVRYPMSHNLIEAMAVGTIPITQYPELFFPALEHGKNCLVFSSPNELQIAVQQAMSMDNAQRAAMKQAAQTYYDQYLAPQACIKRLLEHRPKHISLRLLPFLKAGGGFA